MRFTITVDDSLFNEAKETIGAKTKRQTIEIALEEVVRKKRLEKAAKHAGKVQLGITVEELIEQRKQR